MNPVHHPVNMTLILNTILNLIVLAASSLIRGMLTPKATDRANILDICSHWWINEGYDTSCLDEAEHLANLTPVRLDLLLSLAKAENKMPLNQENNNNEVKS